MSHTPGPWVVNLTQNFALGGDSVSVEAMMPDGKHVNREVASCMLDTDEHPDGPEWLEDCANARLIAAAPDLLAACKEALAALDEAYRATGFFRIAHSSEQRIRIEAAIAKAETTCPMGRYVPRPDSDEKQRRRLAHAAKVTPHGWMCSCPCGWVGNVLATLLGAEGFSFCPSCERKIEP